MFYCTYEKTLNLFLKNSTGTSHNITANYWLLLQVISNWKWW